MVKPLLVKIFDFPKYPYENGYITAYCHRQVISVWMKNEKTNLIAVLLHTKRSSHHDRQLAAHNRGRRQSAALNPWPRRGQEEPREAGSADIHAVLPLAALRWNQVL
jgi:hypothetical protein